MKTSLLLSALFFLLSVAFSTQTLTLAKEYVLDIYGDHLKPGNKYYILDAEDRSRGIEIDQAFGEYCPVTVTIGIDAKKVVFYHSEDHKDATGIKVGEKTDLEFAEFPRCAVSGKWNVSVHGHKKYPVVIGPPEGAITINGSFHISKSDITDAYNIAFKFYGVDDYVLVASTHEQDLEIYSVVFCRPGKHYKKFNVVFQPYHIPNPPSPPTPSPPPPSPSPPPPSPSPPPPTPSPPPPSPSPPPPTPSPPPPSPTPTPSPPPPSPTFVPLIRKVARYAE